jgi:ribonuclease E
LTHATPQHAPFEHGEADDQPSATFAPSDEAALGPGENAPAPGHDAVAREDAAGGNGEHRRRRRGRRGGRRSRRDREGQNGDFAGAQDRIEQHPLPESDQPQWSERSETPQPDIAEATYAPRIEPAAPAPTPPQPAVEPPPPTEPASEQPRRRSTVREPAPAFGASSPAVAAPQQPEPMIVTGSAEADDANRPRRTGWWSKRLLGGDKG